MQAPLSTLIFSPVFNSKVQYQFLFQPPFLLSFVTLASRMRLAESESRAISTLSSWPWLCGLGARQRIPAILSVVPRRSKFVAVPPTKATVQVISRRRRSARTIYSFVVSAIACKTSQDITLASISRKFVISHILSCNCSFSRQLLILSIEALLHYLSQFLQIFRFPLLQKNWHISRTQIGKLFTYHQLFYTLQRLAHFRKLYPLIKMVADSIDQLTWWFLPSGLAFLDLSRYSCLVKSYLCNRAFRSLS